MLIEIRISSFQLVRLNNRRLKWKFKVDEFLTVTVKSPHKDELSRYLLFMHGTFLAKCVTQKGEGSLLVTQYSFLRKSSIFRLEYVMDRDSEIDDKELQLHSMSG